MIASMLLLASGALAIWFNRAHAIIGYDCSQQVSNVTAFSLIQVGECDFVEPVVHTEKVYVRLLQTKEFNSIQVRLCKVEIKRTVKFCGAFSHMKDVRRGEVKYLEEITAAQCQRMHDHRTHQLRNELITDLRPNATTVHPMTFVGTLKANGECDNGYSYTDPYGSFDDVVVTGYVTISLKNYAATVNLEKNEITLQSGTRCAFTDSQCIDMEAGYAFWDFVPDTPCEQKRFVQLYKGQVSKITEENNERRPVYILESDDITFALTATGNISRCSLNLVRTEHPKLFFLEGKEGEGASAISAPTTENLDLFTYVNSKFVYIEKHFKSQLKQLYHDIISQKCELEKRVITNALSLAPTAPDLFALQVTKRQGFMGLVSGEIVYLMRCIQVEVKRRPAMTCYQELPVEHGDKKLFLTPRTHILKEYGTEISCNPLLAPMYFLEDAWYSILPGTIAKGLNPNILAPNTKASWNYTDPAALAKSGIYTFAEIQALRNHLMFPVERPAMLNYLALSMAGKASDKNGMSVARLFDEEALNRLAESTWNKLWTKFLTFGSASAGVIGLFMIARLIKFIADTIIHGYALHSIYGWSIYIIGAVWNSVTQLLLHVGKGPRDPEVGPRPEAPRKTELEEAESSLVSKEENKEQEASGRYVTDRIYPYLAQGPVIGSLPVNEPSRGQASRP